MQAPVPNPVPHGSIERTEERQVDESHGSPTSHEFNGRSCPGCSCDGCEQTLGGKGGKYCRTCYRESGHTLCRSCHAHRQPKGATPSWCGV